MKIIIPIIFLLPSFAHAQSCAKSCKSYEHCSIIATIEIVEKSDKYVQAYKAKILDVETAFPLLLSSDGIGPNGELINPTIEDSAPEFITVVEYGIRKIDPKKSIQDYVFQDHGGSVRYEVGMKYYYFGDNIKDEFYESSVNSCTLKIN